MIQTATLSPVITVSRGPASPQAGAQVSATAVDFAGSFAKASDGAAPIAPPAPAFTPSSPVGSLADPAAPIGDGLREASAAATTRQEWAATGNGLPTPVRADAAIVAAAAAWQPTRTSPLAMDLAPSSPAPVDPSAATATAASTAASAGARPGARPPAMGRPTPASLSRPSTAVGRDDAADDTRQDGDAGDSSASMTDGAAITAPSLAPGAQDIAAPVPLAVPLAALPTAARLVRSEAENPDAAVSTSAETLSQAAPRSRSARRAKLAGLPATAPQPVLPQGRAAGLPIPPGETSSPVSIAATAVPIGSPDPIPVPPAPILPRLAADSVTLPSGSVTSPTANGLVSQGATGPRTELGTGTPAVAISASRPLPSSRARPADAQTLPGGDPGHIPAPALPSASASASPGRSAFAGATAPAPVAGRSNRAGPDASNPLLTETTRKRAIQPAMPPSGMPLATPDRLKPLSVAPLAAHPAPVATGVPAPSSEPPLAIAAKPQRERVSPPPPIYQADALVRAPQDLRPVPASVSAPPPAMPTFAAAVVHAPGITASTAGMPASDPAIAAPAAAAAPAASPPRWTATEATAPVALAMARPELVQPQPGTVASAGQVFGAAIQAAQTASTTRDADKTGSIDAASLSAAVAPSQSVAPAAAPQQAPLDMRQERWPHAMIERIEMIRDAADATDTRIRLIPDALGAIDVSVKTDGATVHVHFAAEQAATRTLLADAQPRLAELAEARGLKLGQGALGDGNTGSSQQRAPTPSQIPNRTTTMASILSADAADDTRIA